MNRYTRSWSECYTLSATTANRLVHPTQYQVPGRIDREVVNSVAEALMTKLLQEVVTDYGGSSGEPEPEPEPKP